MGDLFQMTRKPEATARLLHEAADKWHFERSLAGSAEFFAGVDEAGRGALAGPVVAASVILGGEPGLWAGIDDSKRISKRRRESLHDFISEHAIAIGVGMASAQEIDTYNILQATRMAMGRAIVAMKRHVQLVLVDGLHSPLFEGPEVPSLPVVDGDAKCLSVAAASIVAKVVRDRLMLEMDSRYPQFGFAHHVGYGTKEHLLALDEHGPADIHRMTFAPVQLRREMQVRLDIR